MIKLSLLFFVLIQCVPLSFQMIELNKWKELHVEVKGHVVNPGIYIMNRGDCVEDLLTLAGCFDDSDLRTINQTQTLHDHDVIVVSKMESDLISINSASLTQLMSLPGIGEMIAVRIVEYRSQQPFQTLEDLMNVKGIGEKKFDELRGLICL